MIVFIFISCNLNSFFRRFWSTKIWWYYFFVVFASLYFASFFIFGKMFIFFKRWTGLLTISWQISWLGSICFLSSWFLFVIYCNFTFDFYFFLPILCCVRAFQNVIWDSIFVGFSNHNLSSLYESFFSAIIPCIICFFVF